MDIITIMTNKKVCISWLIGIMLNHMFSFSETTFAGCNPPEGKIPTVSKFKVTEVGTSNSKSIVVGPNNDNPGYLNIQNLNPLNQTKLKLKVYGTNQEYLGWRVERLSHKGTNCAGATQKEVSPEASPNEGGFDSSGEAETILTFPPSPDGFYIKLFCDGDNDAKQDIENLQDPPSEYYICDPDSEVVGSNPEVIEMTILKVDLNLMWETANKANQIFNPTPKDDPVDSSITPNSQEETYGIPRNRLYSTINPLNNKYCISVDINLSPTYLDKTKLRCAFYDNGTIISASDTAFPATGPAAISFSEIAQGETISELLLKAGFDSNSNGQIDQNEEVDLFIPTETPNIFDHPILMAITEAKYQDAKSDIDKIIDGVYSPLTALLLPHAKEHLRIFRDGNINGVPVNRRPIPTPSTKSLDAFSVATGFSEWLTHNSGAQFSPAGVASIKEYTWLPDSSVSSLIAHAYPINPCNDSSSADMISTFLENDQDVQDFNNTASDNDTVWFPLNGGFCVIPNMPYEFTSCFQPSWVSGHTVEVANGGLANLDDANGTVGRARLIGSLNYRFLLRKWQNTVKVDVVRVVGEVQDLYDFNVEAGGPSTPAAITQIGHGNGSYGPTRTYGNIYRARIMIDIGFTPVPIADIVLFD